MSDQEFIRIKGARQHNLRNLDVLDSPEQACRHHRGRAARGNRRSPSTHSLPRGRGAMSRVFRPMHGSFSPGCKSRRSITSRGFLPPSPSSNGSPRPIPAQPSPRRRKSTTYLRVLYASVGVPHDPVTGAPVRRQSPQQIGAEILSWPEGTRLMLLAPLVTNEAGSSVMSSTGHVGRIRPPEDRRRDHGRWDGLSR